MSKTNAWNVFLHGEEIDTVFDVSTDAADVKRSLINHDGFDPDIEVRPEAKPLDWVPDYPDDTGWKKRHLAAVASPRRMERPIIALLQAWLLYAEAVRTEFAAQIGDDGVLGEHWTDIGMGIKGLLNGEAGRLDCGTLEMIIRSQLEAQGFDPNTL